MEIGNRGLYDLMLIFGETDMNLAKFWNIIGYIYCELVIFLCIHFRGFMKMGNFACIKIHVLSIISSLGYYKSNFRGVHIFADVLETRTTRKYVQREYIYVHSTLKTNHKTFCQFFTSHDIFNDI